MLGAYTRALAHAAVIAIAAGVSPARAGEVESARLVPPQVLDAAAFIARGNAYIYGDGVERDHVRALMWFILADNDALYHFVAGGMTPLQVSHAVALAEICAGSNYLDCE